MKSKQSETRMKGHLQHAVSSIPLQVLISADRYNTSFTKSCRIQWYSVNIFIIMSHIDWH